MRQPRVIRESSTLYLAQKERLNLYLPKSLVDDLRRYVPSRQRTQFVIDALSRELLRLRLKEALRLSAGAWRDEDHPELATGEDIDRWIEEGRKTLTRKWEEEG